MQVVRNSLLLSLSLVVGACVAFYPPDEDDDGVQRCETSTDCSGPEYEDTRITGQCVEAAEDSAPKVCVAAWTQVNCVGMGSMVNELGTFYDMAANSSAYVGCDMENLGKPGCASNSGVCDDGQSPISEGEFAGICPHPESDMGWKAYPPRDGVFPAGSDVQDQACRHFFCDRTFVCNTTSRICEPCDPDAAPGEGGCVEMYLQGEPSQIYDVTESDIKNGDPSCGNRTFATDEAFANGVAGAMSGM